MPAMRHSVMNKSAWIPQSPLPLSAQYSAWFEMLPSLPGASLADKGRSGEDSVVTIRPALAQDGKLLKKGTAVR